MEINNLLTLHNRQDLRDWLEKHSTTDEYCWVIVSMTEQPNTLLYLDAVEEALCFGWIDGIKKKISDTELAQRLSPRKKKRGLLVLPDMSPESFIIDEEINTFIKIDKEVYKNFIQLPELYRRIRIDTIQSYKDTPVIYYKRLDKFIKNTRENKLYGLWNDNGRLINY
ncbi:YdeI/OmpD-associated family protein [Bacillus pumilus]|uniref:YdeI/OmpD-associated family protein n=1 Tax=Bacillus TaxID=1386 RepID=UPI0028591F65|nr:YdeI/OmpD-associated family protein [Bacillus pumilus]MDR7250355.1 hypothetical protein [Bacillus pumilus]